MIQYVTDTAVFDHCISEDVIFPFKPSYLPKHHGLMFVISVLTQLRLQK